MKCITSLIITGCLCYGLLLSVNAQARKSQPSPQQQTSQSQKQSGEASEAKEALSEWQTSPSKLLEGLLSYSGDKPGFSLKGMTQNGQVASPHWGVMKEYGGKTATFEGVLDSVEPNKLTWHDPQLAFIKMKGGGIFKTAGPIDINKSEKVEGGGLFVHTGPLALNKWQQLTPGTRVAFRGKIVGIFYFGPGLPTAYPMITVYDAEPLIEAKSSAPASQPSLSISSVSYDLMAAATKGNTTSVVDLLKKGADVNANIDGVTPLMLAALGGHTATVQALVARKADVNAKTKNGGTALMIAARSGHIEIVKALVSKGADVSAKGSDGYTAKDFAGLGGKSETATAIINLLTDAETKK